MSNLTTVDGQKLYRSTKPSDLATADGQKNCRGGKNPPGGGKIPGAALCLVSPLANHAMLIWSALLQLQSQSHYCFSTYTFSTYTYAKPRKSWRCLVIPWNYDLWTVITTVIRPQSLHSWLQWALFDHSNPSKFNKPKTRLWNDILYAFITIILVLNYNMRSYILRTRDN